MKRIFFTVAATIVVLACQAQSKAKVFDNGIIVLGNTEVTTVDVNSRIMLLDAAKESTEISYANFLAQLNPSSDVTADDSPVTGIKLWQGTKAQFAGRTPLDSVWYAITDSVPPLPDVVMTKPVYDVDENSIVDNSELLGGQASSYHLDRTNHTGTQPVASISGFEAAVSANASVAANTAKETNANHSGEVTGDQALTISPSVITNAKMADNAIGTLELQANSVTLAKAATDFYSVDDFTPTIIDGNAAGSYTYTVEKASYVKVGNHCTFVINFTAINTTGTPTGAVIILGFPFNADGQHFFKTMSTNGDVSFSEISTSLPTGTSVATLVINPASGTTNNAAYTGVTYTSGTITISGSYLVQ